MVKNPRKEIRRILSIMAQRDNDKFVVKKFKLFGIAISAILLFKKFRQAFIEALKECDFSKFQFDDADEYWIAYRKDYMFQGKTTEERQKIQKDLGLYLPKIKKI